MGLKFLGNQVYHSPSPLLWYHLLYLIRLYHYSYSASILDISTNLFKRPPWSDCFWRHPDSSQLKRNISIFWRHFGHPLPHESVFSVCFLSASSVVSLVLYVQCLSTKIEHRFWTVPIIEGTPSEWIRYLISTDSGSTLFRVGITSQKSGWLCILTILPPMTIMNFWSCIIILTSCCWNSRKL